MWTEMEGKIFELSWKEGTSQVEGTIRAKVLRETPVLTIREEKKKGQGNKCSAHKPFLQRAK